jgi:hypothetical protein
LGKFIFVFSYSQYVSICNWHTNKCKHYSNENFRKNVRHLPFSEHVSPSNPSLQLQRNWSLDKSLKHTPSFSHGSLLQTSTKKFQNCWNKFLGKIFKILPAIIHFFTDCICFYQQCLLSEQCFNQWRCRTSLVWGRKRNVNKRPTHAWAL